MKTTTSKATVIAFKTVFDCLGQAEDISDRVKRMPRDAAILYPKRTKSARLDYQGVVRLSGSGLYYWIALWFSVLAPSPVGGIRFTPWNRAHPFSGQQPAPGLEPVTAKIALALGGTHLEGRTERAQIEIWPRLAKGKEVFELILAPAKREASQS